MGFLFVATNAIYLQSLTHWHLIITIMIKLCSLKVNVDQVPSIKYILGVYAMPSFFSLKDGVKVGSFMGANESLLRKGLENGGNVGGICSYCRIQ